jgi:glycerophosphoryl diester phosphodiesterase
MRDHLLELAQAGCDLLMSARPYREGTPDRRPKVIAHRGAWDGREHIENTLSAFHRAKHLGANGIEFDLHFTLDDAPVIHHDTGLERLFKHKRFIRDLSFADLRKNVPQIPSLEEVLVIPDLHFMIEIKTSLTPRQEKILHDLLSGFEALRDFHLLVLNPDLVRLSPKFPGEAWILVGELNLARLVEVSVRRRLGGVAGHYLGMTDKLIQRLHKADQIAGSGFIPGKNLFRREWSRGTDFVFTNSTARIF